MPQKLAFSNTCVMIVLSYLIIWKMIRKSRKQLEAALKGNVSSTRKKTENKLTMTIFLICSCFIIFVLPLMLSEFLHGSVNSNVIVGWYWTQYSINIIIYAGRKDAFQNAYIDLFWKVWSKSKSAMPSQITSTTAIETTSKKDIHPMSSLAASTDANSKIEKSTLNESDDNKNVVIGVAGQGNANPSGKVINQSKNDKDNNLLEMNQISSKISSKIRNNKIVISIGIILLTLFLWFSTSMSTNKSFYSKLVILGGSSLNSARVMVDIKGNVQIIDLIKEFPCDIRSLQLKKYIGTTNTEAVNLPSLLIGAKGGWLHDRLIYYFS